MTVRDNAEERLDHWNASAPPQALRHWRESYFFVAHPPQPAGDMLILTVVSHPSRGLLECYQMGRIGGHELLARQARRYGQDPHTPVVGPAEVEVVRPYRTVRLRVADQPDAPIGLDLTWSARTRPHVLPRGAMTVDGALVWDQWHMFQSGWFDGTYTVDGRTRTVRWWGQRDHSWGVRDHRRCPLWIWLAIQLPDGMLGVWCWEYSDGTRAYTEGCWAPAGDDPPVPVAGFTHDLGWTGADGRPVGYGRDGTGVCGLAGRVEFRLADGRRVGVTGEGTWAARYGRRGGGQQLMALRTDDGRCGTGVYELTGAHHHRYFPIPRTAADP